MDEVRDQSYYTKPFKRFKTITKNSDNDPLITVFYADEDFSNWVFKWTQKWFADGKLESWKVTLKS